MKNIEKILEELEKIQISKAENLPLLRTYFLSGKTITFFSWKMFDVKLDRDRQPVFNNTFNSASAKKFITREIRFLKLLKRYNVSFDYIKIIPNELPIYFWGVKNLGVKKFSRGAAKFFNQVYPRTKVILFTELLRKNNLTKIYSEVLNKVYIEKPYSKIEFEEEMKTRFYSKELARRAFALFAAEATVLYGLSKKTLPNLILLAGKRSLNTYKYEFYRFPKSRPVLPKLFVI